jgi:signal transduction histidine kinase
VTVAQLFALRQNGDRPDLHTIAHDLNNLLTAISGYASLVVAADDAPSGVQRDAAEIVDAANRAVQLVRQLQHV